MSKSQLIRAWKDEEYRLSLSEAERAELLESPVGRIELTDTELGLAAGGGKFCYKLSLVIKNGSNGNFTCWISCIISVLNIN